MAQQIPSSITEIARAIKAQLVAKAGFQASAIFITSRKAASIPHTVGEKDIVLNITGERPNEHSIQGAGGLNDQGNRNIVLTIRTRRATDMVGSDENHLLNEDTGHIAVEDAVINALELFWPTDLQNNTLINYPMRRGPLSDSQEERELPEWLNSSITIEVDYSRFLSPQLR